MDLSKLPGKEQVEGGKAGGGMEGVPAALDAPAAPVMVRDVGSPVVVAGPEAVLYVGIGLVICFLTSRFFAWVMHVLFGAEFGWTFTAEDGTPIGYLQSWSFVADVPVAMLGISLILEGVLLATVRKRWAVWAVVYWAGVTCLLNLGGLVYLYNKTGLQLWLLIGAVLSAYSVTSIGSRLRDVR